MKFIVERDVWDRALQSAIRIIDPKAAMPVLSGLQIMADDHGLIVIATDLFTMLTIRCAAIVEESGSMVLPGHLLTDLVHCMPSCTIEVTTDESSKVRIRYGSKNRATLYRMTDVLPTFEQVATDHAMTMTIPAEALQAVMRRTSFACARDDFRPALQGIAWMMLNDRMTAVATDSARLSLASLPWYGEPFGTIIVPIKALIEAARLNASESVTMTLDDQLMRVVNQDQILSARLLDGSYPDVQPIIPSTYVTEVHVATSAMRDALERLNLFTSLERSGSIEMSVDETGLTLSATAAEFGQVTETISCDGTGEPLTLFFNPIYLLDAIKPITDEQLYLRFAGAQAPLQLSDASHSGYVHYILPLRQIVKV
jgi:DNA polymerase-3 subunit beta